MALSRRSRTALAWLLGLPAGAAAGLQILGQLLQLAGDRAWVACHRLVRDPRCRCADCPPPPLPPEPDA